MPIAHRHQEGTNLLGEKSVRLLFVAHFEEIDWPLWAGCTGRTFAGLFPRARGGARHDGRRRRSLAPFPTRALAARRLRGLRRQGWGLRLRRQPAWISGGRGRSGSATFGTLSPLSPARRHPARQTWHGGQPPTPPARRCLPGAASLRTLLQDICVAIEVFRRSGSPLAARSQLPLPCQSGPTDTSPG